VSKRRALWIGIPLAALAGAATVMLVLQVWRTPAPEPTADPATVTAERTTLTSNLTLSGQLTYGRAIVMPGHGGIITRLPRPGDTVAVGQAVYEVDGRPVIVLRGERPFWRSLELGMTNGPDVLQLEQALAGFGFGTDLTVDQQFTWVTAAAVKNWQQALGLERTGVVAVTDIVAVNADAMRVAAVAAVLGEPAGSSVLTYTGTLLRAEVDLTAAQAREIVPGVEVTVTLPDGTVLPAMVGAVDQGGQPTAEEGETTDPFALIDFTDPAAVAVVGLRAVKVALAREEVEDALVVPVTALVATLDGGYAVDVLRADGVERIPVELGLIADARAQIVGGALAEGDLVVVSR